MIKMYAKYLMVLILLPGFYCEPCGEPAVCQCYESLSLISCREIKEFPRFNRADIWNIDMLDIVNSSLTEIPNLEEWPNLSMLNWMENGYSGCKELNRWYGRIYVNSDCPRTSLSTIDIKEGNEVFLWPFFLTIIPFSLLGIVGGYRIIFQYTKKPLKEPNARLKIYTGETVV